MVLIVYNAKVIDSPIDKQNIAFAIHITVRFQMVIIAYLTALHTLVTAKQPSAAALLIFA